MAGKLREAAKVEIGKENLPFADSSYSGSIGSFDLYKSFRFIINIFLLWAESLRPPLMYLHQKNHCLTLHLFRHTPYAHYLQYLYARRNKPTRFS